MVHRWSPTSTSVLVGSTRAWSDEMPSVVNNSSIAAWRVVAWSSTSRPVRWRVDGSSSTAFTDPAYPVRSAVVHEALARYDDERKRDADPGLRREELPGLIRLVGD